MIRIIAMAAIVSASRTVALDFDSDSSPAANRVRAESLLSQIETSLALTAQQLDIESATRQIRVKAESMQLRGEIGFEELGQMPGESQILGPRAGRREQLRAHIGRIEYRESISMQRDALINSFPRH